jgi:ABC-type transport system involved in multi-copper enzyme maturation permease subunit
VAAEFIKLSAHPFFYLAVALLAGAIVAAETFLPRARSQSETLWKALNSLQLFAYGFKFGLLLASFVLLIFSSMMFAGEFDKGTIKNLLTRPITRTDLFLAKGVTVLALAVILYLFVLYVSLFYAFARGDLGPVWDDGQYIMHRGYEELASYARRTVLVSFLPFLAAGFFGILISNFTESSGYAVAIALVIYFNGYLSTGWFGDPVQRLTLFYHVTYAVEKLQIWAEGGRTRWNPDVERGLLYATVPLAYIAGFLPVAYGVFRSRNVNA